jgi:hypothetical protein
VQVRHGEDWCSALCRRLDIRSAWALHAYEAALARFGAHQLTDMALAEERFRLRVAMLALDERAWPWAGNLERLALREDIASGLLKVPEGVDRSTVRGSPEWRHKISEARRARRGAA